MKAAGNMNQDESNGLEDGAKRSAPRPHPQGRFTLIHMMLLVFFCALLFRVGVHIPWQFLAFFVVIALPAFVVAFPVTLVARKETQQEALLWVLAIAAEQEMPLAPGLEAVADQYGGRFRRRVLALADWLNSGESLPDALLKVPGLLTDPVGVLIRVGSETGSLAKGLREAAGARAARPPVRHPVLSKLAYLCALMFVIQGITGFIMYFIVPKFEAIYADFGVKLPEMTILAIGISHSVMRSFLLPIFIVVEIVFLAAVPLVYLGWLNLPIPLIDAMARRRHTVVILRALALVVDAGQPIMTALGILSRHYPAWGIRNRLIRVLYCVGDGADWWDCLRLHGLVKSADAAVLASAQRAGNVAWALREMAESSERRLVYRLQAWAQILFPIVVISVGALVFLFAAAYFSPLITLIEDLARL